MTLKKSTMDEEAAYDVTADSTGRPTTPMGKGPKFDVLLIDCTLGVFRVTTKNAFVPAKHVYSVNTYI